MSWHAGEHSKKFPDSVNAKWENVRGDLSVDQAQEWLVKYLSANPSAAARLLIGNKFGKLRPIQDVLIRIWFKRNINMLIAGRGFSKSYTAAIFITLYAILNPGVKIGIFSASFRQAKLIFEQVENFIKDPGAVFLRQCQVGEIKHGTDSHVMTLGKSTIKALPLTPKARGERFSLVVVDEYLSVPEVLIKEIVDPMAAVKPGNPEENAKISKYEDKLIAAGEMHEWERTRFIESKKIMLSSASYETDSLYKITYKRLYDEIHDKDAKSVNCSVCRLSYKLAPKGQLDEKNISDALKTFSTAQFEREYMAIFTKETDRFYSRSNILAATVQVEHEPSITIKGRPGKEYILAIDPQFSAGSEDADNFAMSLLEMDGETGALVHAYALAKSHLKNRAVYFKYILENFNVQLIILDHAGGPKFLEEFEVAFPDFKNKPKLIELDYTTDEAFEQTKYNYNPSDGRIAISVVFNQNNFVRTSNEDLQADIQHKKIIFGSPMTNSDRLSDINKAYNIGVAMKDLEFRNIADENITEEALRFEFMDTVDENVEKTKDELVLIEMNSTITGGYTFDLPKSAKRWTGKDRARRDSYTALLLANRGRRIFLKLRNNPIDQDFHFNGGWIS